VNRVTNAPIVVIGANVDALVAAHRLSMEGRSVVAIDQGFATDADAATTLAPGIVDALRLREHGLVTMAPDPWASVPLAEGGRLDLYRDMARTIESIARLSPRDAERWPAFCARVHAAAQILAEVYAAPPPDPMTHDRAALWRMAKLAFDVRRRGRQGVVDLLRFTPMPVADLLDDWFETPALKAALAALGVRDLAYGPRAGGTGFVMLHHHVGCAPGVFRESRSNAADVLRGRAGIDMRTGKRVASIEVRAGRVAAVRLDDGETLPVAAVLSGLDVHTTLTRLVDAKWLDPELLRAVRHLRGRGVVARLSIGLDRAPGFAHLVGAGSMDDLQRSADDAKFGRVAGQPWFEATYVESSGAHRLDVRIQHVPHRLRGAQWSGDLAKVVERAVRSRLEAAAPGIGVSIRSMAFASPADLAERFGWHDGQSNDAELTLDQALWMRPVPALAQYAAPVAGLFLCGPGMHPGRGGWAGWHAAGAVLANPG